MHQFSLNSSELHLLTSGSHILDMVNSAKRHDTTIDYLLVLFWLKKSHVYDEWFFIFVDLISGLIDMRDILSLIMGETYFDCLKEESLLMDLTALSYMYNDLIN